MPDARHPKQYPRGPKYPKLPVNDAWKRRVIAALEVNSRTGRPPKNPAELARLIGADKGGLHKMLTSKQDTYKYARQISDVLSLGDAMVENPEITEDEWDHVVRAMRGKPLEQQRQAIRVLRTLALDEK